MVDVALVSGVADVSSLNAIIANLQQENGQIRDAMETLDAQHEIAIQDVLGQKTELQTQLATLKQLQTDRLVEHELAMARLQAQLVDERKRQLAAVEVQHELQQRVEQQAEELKRSVFELAEMHQLLEKRGADNGELIERVRQADALREALQRELDELIKKEAAQKEKKTSESSNSSSTGKHSEDEFIVVRNADAEATGSDPDPDPDADADADATTPPSKEKLRDKLVALEAHIAELTAANVKLQDGELERQLAANVLNEQLSELETRLRISESEKEQLQLELQRKLQQLMLQNQELKLNAEADQETHANDLEQQLGAIRDENRRLRQELDASIAQAKFRQAIAEEKQEITDLDLELDSHDSKDEHDPHKLHGLLEALIAEGTDQALERTHRLLNERWQRLDSTEQRLVELQDQQLISEHEKKTLEADISQYILQCDELMKNNELLLNELEKFKRNKLETIEEHHEETIAQLESQLDDAQIRLQDALLLRRNDAAQLEQQSDELAAKQQQLEQLTAEVHQLRQQKPKDDSSSELQLVRLQHEELQLAKDSQHEQLLQQLQAKDKQLQQLQTQNQTEIEQLKQQMVELHTQLQASTEHSEQLQANELVLLERMRCTDQLKSELEALQEEMKRRQLELAESKEQNVELMSQLAELQSQVKELKETPKDGADEESVNQLSERLEQQLAASAQLQQSLDMLNAEKVELIKALQQKITENTQYYAEIQRLQPIEQQLNDLIKEREKLCDQISFLKEKSDILTSNLLTEQTNQRLLQQQQIESNEQQAAVQRDLERLRAHLLEIEELHTQESVELQRELDEARANQTALQQEVSKSSTAYTSASIRANQQAETLQAQHALLLQQRDELLAKLGQCEDRELKQQAALTNLQCALEQFQNDKEHDIELATQRIRREMQAQLEQHRMLRSEMGALQQQLADANQGLRAAARLSDQLEAGQQTIAVLRDEVDSLRDENMKLEQSLSSSESSQTDKIDKSLIKSLLIGYVVSGHANDKQQVLRMISSVLDFNAQEVDKVGLNKQQTSWLGNILGGASSSAGNTGSGAGHDNLVQAFVQFLEQESQPKSTAQLRPNLLSMAKQLEGKTDTAATAPTMTATTTISTTTAGSEQLMTQATPATPTTPAMLPMQSLLMSSSEFAPTRNSSSILKDILNDS
ncbi:thyroid receptor-interacting protein 11 isoform X2 [Drosophila grimshawi]|uniref:GH24162 n=2 Tax=Drosophila grimshawi TaxID=7222 RepID=B4JNC6_DROGR|nr:thyroid receptor-interacting protein 11 isoform X2 [Drosophila grimshawi]EDV92219.1 GH24162 [Drosophila grimshawi]